MPSIFTLSPRGLLRRVSARSIIDDIKAAFSTTTSEQDAAESDLLTHPQGIAVSPAPMPDITPDQTKPARRPLPYPPTKLKYLTRINPKTFDDRLSTTPIFARTDSRSKLPSQTILRRNLCLEREHHFFQTWADMSDISSEAATICEASTDGEWDASGADTAATTPVNFKAVEREQAPGTFFNRPALKRVSTTPVSIEVGERQAPGPAGPFFEAPALKRAPALRRKRSIEQLRGGQ